MRHGREVEKYMIKTGSLFSHLQNVIQNRTNDSLPYWYKPTCILGPVDGNLHQHIYHLLHGKNSVNGVWFDV